MLDLRLVPVRFAPGSEVGSPTSTENVTVEVIEPEEARVLPPLPLPPPTKPYRIPRRPPPPVPLKKSVKKLNKRKEAVLADKLAKQEAKKKKKNCPRAKRFCKICEISCNGTKTFYDHLQSRAHRIKVQNARSPPKCTVCDRLFESHGHLERHKNGAAHLKQSLRNIVEDFQDLQ